MARIIRRSSSQRVKIYQYRELKRMAARGKLDRDVLEKIHSDWSEGACSDDYWHEYLLGEDYWKAALAQIGFGYPDIRFSGFWSQGDGASFTAQVDAALLLQFLAEPVAGEDCIKPAAGTFWRTPSGEDWRAYLVHKCGGVAFNPKFAKLVPLAHRGWLTATVERGSHHYAHERTCRFEANFEDRGEPARKADGSPDWGTWISEQPRTYALFEEFQATGEQLRLDLCRAIYKSLEEEYEYQTSVEAMEESLDGQEAWFYESGKRYRY